MNKKTLVMIAAAAAVGGICFFWWKRSQASAAGLSAGARPVVVPYFAPAARLPAIVAAGGWQDATGTHIPAAQRTPAETILAAAAERAANTGASHF
jgi:hypothetical protein